MTKRDTGKERHWRRAVAEQQQSGLSIRAFCGQRGLAESAFYFWRGELARRDRQIPSLGVKRLMRRRSQPASGKTPTLVPLTVIPPAAASAVPLELALPSSMVLRIGADAPWELVRRMLKALGINRPQSEERRPC